MKKPYERPNVYELGTIEGLTHATPEVDKCSGNGDIAFPQELSTHFAGDCN